jgi:hypothetical protein
MGTQIYLTSIGKISPYPPFDYAQGMLFQRGELVPFDARRITQALYLNKPKRFDD